MAGRVKPCSGGDCIKVDMAAGSDKVILWSSRAPAGALATLAVDPDEWIKFVKQVKAGEFDHVLPDD